MQSNILVKVKGKNRYLSKRKLLWLQLSLSLSLSPTLFLHYQQNQPDPQNGTHFHLSITYEIAIFIFFLSSASQVSVETPPRGLPSTATKSKPHSQWVHISSVLHKSIEKCFTSFIIHKTNTRFAESGNWKTLVSTALAAAVVTVGADMSALADLNKFEAEQRGEFGIGSAAQFGSADLRSFHFQTQLVCVFCGHSFEFWLLGFFELQESSSCEWKFQVSFFICWCK